MSYPNTTYPTTLDVPTNPGATDLVGTFDHAGLEDFQNNAITALETKVGVNGSAVTTTLDYKTSGIPASDKAASLTGSETLTNKILTTPTIGSFVNSQHNHQNTAGGGTLDVSAVQTGVFPIARLATGTPSGLKFLRDDGTLAVPTVTVAPTWIDIAHTAGSLPTASSSDVESYNSFNGSTTFTVEASGIPAQNRLITTDWASATQIRAWATLGGFHYVFVHDTSNNYRVYRYTANNLAAGGTNMTISGQSFATTGGNNCSMVSDGTNFWFNFKGGNSANDYVISKYTISGTTLTYVSDVTCGSAANSMVDFAVKSDGTFYGISTSDSKFRKFSSSGTIQYTTPAYTSVNSLYNFADTIYLGVANSPILGYAKLIS